MFSREKRLNLKKDFQWVAAGEKLDSSYLKLFINFSNNKLPRIGIAISSAKFKRAHDRNRARRVISAAFQALYDRLPTNANFVALPKPSIIGVKSGDVRWDLEERLKQANLIKDETSSHHPN